MGDRGFTVTLSEKFSMQEKTLTITEWLAIAD